MSLGSWDSGHAAYDLPASFTRLHATSQKAAAGTRCTCPISGAGVVRATSPGENRPERDAGRLTKPEVNASNPSALGLLGFEALTLSGERNRRAPLLR
jgi:hypothetical protein